MGDPTYRDEEVPNIFFLTYRSFAKAEEFFAFLVKKFYSYPVDNSNEGKQIFEENIDSMRLKILSVFHKWIEHHYHDFGIQAQLRVNLETFLDILVHENGAYAEVAKGIRFVLGIQVYSI